MPAPLSFRDRFFAGPFAYMEEALNGLMAERRAITQNIANVNNPNYHPIHVSFRDQLERMYQEFWAKFGLDGDEMEMSPITSDFDPEFNAENSDDGHIHPVITRDPMGKVDLNYEMGKLYENQLNYHIIAENNRPTYGRDVLDQMLK